MIRVVHVSCKEWISSLLRPDSSSVHEPCGWILSESWDHDDVWEEADPMMPRIEEWQSTHFFIGACGVAYFERGAKEIF